MTNRKYNTVEEALAAEETTAKNDFANLPDNYTIFQLWCRF